MPALNPQTSQKALTTLICKASSWSRLSKRKDTLQSRRLIKQPVFMPPTRRACHVAHAQHPKTAHSLSICKKSKWKRSRNTISKGTTTVMTSFSRRVTASSLGQRNKRWVTSSISCQISFPRLQHSMRLKEAQMTTKKSSPSNTQALPQLWSHKVQTSVTIRQYCGKNRS